MNLNRVEMTLEEISISLQRIADALEGPRTPDRAHQAIETLAGLRGSQLRTETASPTVVKG